MLRVFFLILFLAFGCGFTLDHHIFSFLNLEKVAFASQTKPTTEKLSKEIEERISRVPEFQFIRQEAEKLGVKVYLFGGTASAYAHYVRQDLAREAGDKRYPEMLYDYDYTNIFRSTQDLDIVVDGDAEKAALLEDALRGKFPHFIGDKGAKWEVRPLREARGEKEAILNNPDFMNQHTDSHSTGMVEVTKPTKGESAIKDVRDWNSKAPQFLKDVQSQKLHYYFSPQHAGTSRAKQGLNPPILSVIRYLTKAFQYDLEIAPEDKKLISKIIQEFDPKSLKDGGYLERWVEKNGKKLFEHAVDIEHAWDTLEELGLRKKLISIQNNADVLDSLAWLMNKEPLRSKPVGKGKGKTAAQIAKELGQDKLTVAHETRSYLAYESITRSKAGDLNAFISREKAEWESASFGDGFYTQIGKTGARGTGLTIRMELDPNAREGTDFTRVGNYIILENRNAARVIPEQINLSLLGYFELLAEGEEFSSDDRALIESFRRKISRTNLMKEQEVEEIHKLVLNKIQSEERVPEALLREWFTQPKWREYEDIITEIFKRDKRSDSWITGRGRPYGAAVLLENTAKDPFWRTHSNYIETMLRNGNELLVFTHFLGDSYWIEKYPEWIDTILSQKKLHPAVYDLLNQTVFQSPASTKHLNWMKAMIDNIVESKAGIKMETMFSTLSLPHWQDHPEFIDKLLQENWGNGNQAIDIALTRYVLGHSYAAEHPEWLRKVIDRGWADDELIRYVLFQPYWLEQPDIILDMFKQRAKNPWRYLRNFVEIILPRLPAKQLSEAVEILMQKKNMLLWLKHFLNRMRFARSGLILFLMKARLSFTKKWLQIF